MTSMLEASTRSAPPESLLSEQAPSIKVPRIAKPAKDFVMTVSPVLLPCVAPSGSHRLYDSSVTAAAGAGNANA